MSGSGPGVEAGPAVLVVAEDHLLRWSIRLALEELPCTLYEAEDNARALELLRQHRCRVALVDMGCPGHSGLELIPQLREAAPDCRQLLLHDEECQRTLAPEVEQSLSGRLARPCDLGDLRDQVQALLAD